MERGSDRARHYLLLVAQAIIDIATQDGTAPFERLRHIVERHKDPYPLANFDVPPEWSLYEACTLNSGVLLSVRATINVATCRALIEQRFGETGYLSRRPHQSSLMA